MQGQDLHLQWHRWSQCNAARLQRCLVSCAVILATSWKKTHLKPFCIHSRGTKFFLLSDGLVQAHVAGHTKRQVYNPLQPATRRRLQTEGLRVCRNISELSPTSCTVSTMHPGPMAGRLNTFSLHGARGRLSGSPCLEGLTHSETLQLYIHALACT